MNILIAGTRSDLGSGPAVHYLKEGHCIYGISRKSDANPDKHKNFRYISQNLSNFEEIENKIGTFLDGLTTLHQVILNAGFFK